jgi:CheY-like chemotaxis protein
LIDLSTALAIVSDVQTRMQDLDGLDLTDHPEDDSTTKTAPRVALRAEKAQASRDLQWCADSLSLAAGVIRNELWTFKGEIDVLREVE